MALAPVVRRQLGSGTHSGPSDVVESQSRFVAIFEEKRPKMSAPGVTVVCEAVVASFWGNHVVGSGIAAAWVSTVKAELCDRVVPEPRLLCLPSVSFEPASGEVDGALVWPKGWPASSEGVVKRTEQVHITCRGAW